MGMKFKVKMDEEEVSKLKKFKNYLIMQIKTEKSSLIFPNKKMMESWMNEKFDDYTGVVNEILNKEPSIICGTCGSEMKIISDPSIGMLGSSWCPVCSKGEDKGDDDE